MTRTQFFQFLPPFLLLHPTPLYPVAAPSHPPPSFSQHCALDESASVCLKGRVVHGVAWDKLSAKATGLHRNTGNNKLKK